MQVDIEGIVDKVVEACTDRYRGNSFLLENRRVQPFISMARQSSSYCMDPDICTESILRGFMAPFAFDDGFRRLCGRDDLDMTDIARGGTVLYIIGKGKGSPLVSMLVENIAMYMSSFLYGSIPDHTTHIFLTDLEDIPEIPDLEWMMTDPLTNGMSFHITCRDLESIDAMYGEGMILDLCDDILFMDCDSTGSLAAISDRTCPSDGGFPQIVPLQLREYSDSGYHALFIGKGCGIRTTCVIDLDSLDLPMETGVRGRDTEEYDLMDFEDEDYRGLKDFDPSEEDPFDDIFDPDDLLDPFEEGYVDACVAEVANIMHTDRIFLDTLDKTAVMSYLNLIHARFDLRKGVLALCAAISPRTRGKLRETILEYDMVNDPFPWDELESLANVLRVIFSPFVKDEEDD